MMLCLGGGHDIVKNNKRLPSHFIGFLSDDLYDLTVLAEELVEGCFGLFGLYFLIKVLNVQGLVGRDVLL